MCAYCATSPFGYSSPASADALKCNAIGDRRIEEPRSTMVLDGNVNINPLLEIRQLERSVSRVELFSSKTPPSGKRENPICASSADTVILWDTTSPKRVASSTTA